MHMGCIFAVAAVTSILYFFSMRSAQFFAGAERAALTAIFLSTKRCSSLLELTQRSAYSAAPVTILYAAPVALNSGS
eukprot:5862302-Pleurochrysis_carterae.AAC.1